MLQESSKQVEEIVKFLKPEVVLSFWFQAFSSLIFFVHFLMIGFCLLQIVFLALCSDRQEVLFHDSMEVSTLLVHILDNAIMTIRGSFSCIDNQHYHSIINFFNFLKALTMGEMNAMRKEKYSISRIIISWLDAEACFNV